MGSRSESPAPTLEPQPLAVPITGQQLLDAPLLSKGSAFTVSERQALDLLGLLPPHVATLDEQLARTYESNRQRPGDLEKHIYLAAPAQLGSLAAVVDVAALLDTLVSELQAAGFAPSRPAILTAAAPRRDEDAGEPRLETSQ